MERACLALGVVCRWVWRVCAAVQPAGEGLPQASQHMRAACSRACHVTCVIDCRARLAECGLGRRVWSSAAGRVGIGAGHIGKLGSMPGKKGAWVGAGCV